ncbi:hypothetical protein AXF42_Ash000800 [Apostasia shenzhenica]|uniref:GST C-terminal domain-containing protein n=1 Tax=Apostasia shenzhenica TaxID=1088818 RepID=A0A2I0AT48_9ASPA|nr:hypothetical protein AXF42_Ash000800 [Apostasia shenzhenica]
MWPAPPHPLHRSSTPTLPGPLLSSFTRRPLPHRRRSSLQFSSSSSSPPSSLQFDPLTAAGRLLWGHSLPPGTLVSAARVAWSSVWHLMMRQLAPSSPSGSYSRPPSPFPIVPPSYLRSPAHLHLYAALPCPWAHRTLIVRALRSLESAVPFSLAAPGPDGSWQFLLPAAAATGAAGNLIPTADLANGRRTLRDVYESRPGGYRGRSTVPMLWDPDRRDVICNESYAIIEFFNAIGSGCGDLAPAHLRPEIENWNRIIHPKINNGVYRCGFAQSQEAYDAAAAELFSAMDEVEDHLSSSRFLCGEQLTLADVCLFTTLIRFDVVYNVLFRCTKKKLVEYPNLHGYAREIYQMPKVAETCDLPAIVEGYYGTLFPLNPGGIRPAMPAACERDSLSKPHNRGSISAA